MTPPPDPVIRQVLDLIETRHVEPERIAPVAMLQAALVAARQAGAVLASAPPAWLVGRTGEAAVLVPPAAAWTRGGPVELSTALGPSLEALLLALAGPDDTQGAERARRARVALLDAVLRRVDRWSSATGGRQRLALSDRFRGSVTGIGVRVGRRDGVARVLGVIQGSAAQQAGLVAGDVLLRIGGRDVGGQDMTTVLSLLRGSVGSQVDVTVARDPPGTLSIERRLLGSAGLPLRVLAGRVGVLAIRNLSKATPQQVERALQSATRSGPLVALVLDLRGNTGGSMLAAARIADLFVTAGVLIEALGNDGRAAPGLAPRVEATAAGDGLTPLAVLTDERTASSSELLAAALAWNDRAVIAGRRTYGKTVVGKLHDFPQVGLTVKLSSAFMRAAGRRLPAEGLEPDLVLAPSADGSDSDAVLAVELARHGRPSRAQTLRRFADDASATWRAPATGIT